MNIVVTGAAGFIGMHCAERALKNDYQVLGVDNFNNYYDSGLKRARVGRLVGHRNFTLSELDITDTNKFNRVFREFSPELVLHLAAQAGVRYVAQVPGT